MNRAWRERLPALARELAAAWELTLGAAFVPEGTTAWVAPALTASGRDLVLKLGWRHWEADHEADGLQVWHGGGAVRCARTERFGDTEVLLLERCVPGQALGATLPESEQDVVIAGRGTRRRLDARARAPPGVKCCLTILPSST